jgi:hypothetical protein
MKCLTMRVKISTSPDERKYPNASLEWGWQWVFPASTRYIDCAAGLERRHHIHESVVQKGDETGCS